MELHISSAFEILWSEELISDENKLLIEKLPEVKSIESLPSFSMPTVILTSSFQVNLIELRNKIYSIINNQINIETCLYSYY